MPGGTTIIAFVQQPEEKNKPGSLTFAKTKVFY